MKTPNELAKHGGHRKSPTGRLRVRPQVPPTAEAEPTGRRLHADSYADVIPPEDELVGTSSTHVAHSDRRLEEPSDPGRGTPERGEDST